MKKQEQRAQVRRIIGYDAELVVPQKIRYVAMTDANRIGMALASDDVAYTYERAADRVSAATLRKITILSGGQR